jgi:sulfur carrier protein
VIKLAMIEITLNGAPLTLDAPLAVTAFLAAQGLAGKRVAVERNGEIIPRSKHPDVIIEAGDHIEIVVAVGGG